MLNKRFLGALIAAALLFCFVASVVSAEKLKGDAPLRFGVAAMISPKETISTYRRILHYLSEKLDRPVKMVQRKTYSEMDGLLENKNVPIAMICSGPYVRDHEKFGVEILAAPVMYGKPFYHSYLIVNKESAIKNLEGLRGKRFTFSDPKSNTGCLVPTYMLAKIGETPDTFFSEYVYSGHHSKSIEMVATGKVDGAAVDHLIWEYMQRTNPEFTSQTKVVSKSPAYGMPPVVVHPDMPAELKKRIRNIMLTMHEDETGRKILSDIFIEKYVVPPDSNYDTVREMIIWVEGSKE